MTEVASKQLKARGREASGPFPERVWLSIFFVVQLLWLSAVGYGVHLLAAL
jgi:hypothetical protein